MTVIAGCGHDVLDGRWQVLREQIFLRPLDA